MNLKLYFIAAVFLNFCLLAKINAQVLRNPNFKKIENFKLNTLPLNNSTIPLRPWNEKTVKPGINLNHPVIEQGIPGNAELIDRNKHFDIYKLPLDNMFCLTPNALFWQSMNTMKQGFIKSNGLDSNDNMPNPFKEQELIPFGK